MKRTKIVFAEPKAMTLLPPAPHRCQECAVEHAADQPHDATSLFYQTKFYMQNKRGATWSDAFAHCDEQLRAAWTEQLAELGIDVQSEKVRP